MNLKEKLLNEILPSVSKPARYIGSEWNLDFKPPEKEDLLFALAFPDTYEIGMSNLGIQILYHILKKMTGVHVERTFAPWPDMEQKLYVEELPLFTLESYRPLADFHILGFSLQHELNLSNVITILKSARIPVYSKERSESDPFILGGGPVSFNPEPVADFFDAFILGDGEECLPEFLAKYKQIAGRTKKKQEIYRELARLPGVYVPSFYNPVYDSEGILQDVEMSPDQPFAYISKCVFKNLDDSSYPVKPLVPLSRVVHDRLSVEVARGCKHICRFCQSGIISKPVRFRSKQKVIELTKETIENTGYDEVALSAFNIIDYPHLIEVMEKLLPWLSPRHVSLAFPSLRPKGLTPRLMDYAQRIRKSGFTLAPEAGDDRMKAVINKNISNDDLIEIAANAFQLGWKHLKLYFMFGLPGETREDLDAVIKLCNKILQKGRSTVKGHLRLNVSLSAFVPKPDTAFQWEPQCTLDEFHERLNYFKKSLKNRNINVKHNSPEMSRLEAILARGDRLLGPAMLKAWELGARFDGWEESFRSDIWEQAFEETGIDPAKYIYRNIPLDEILPWDHLITPNRKKFLKEDCLRSRHLQTIQFPGEKEDAQEKTSEEFPAIKSVGDSSKKPVRFTEAQSKRCSAFIRAAYSKREHMRFLSHLDVMKMLHMAMRRAKIPVAFSQGYNPHPRISFGPPLPVGTESYAEYLDLMLYKKITAEDFIRDMNHNLPECFEFKKAKLSPTGTPSLNKVLKTAAYVLFHDYEDDDPLKKDDPAGLLKQFLDQKEIILPNGKEAGKFIVSYDIAEQENYCIRLMIVMKIINGGILNPQELLRAAFNLTDEQTGRTKCTRLDFFRDEEAQFPALS